MYAIWALALEALGRLAAVAENCESGDERVIDAVRSSLFPPPHRAPHPKIITTAGIALVRVTGLKDIPRVIRDVVQYLRRSLVIIAPPHDTKFIEVARNILSGLADRAVVASTTKASGRFFVENVEGVVEALISAPGGH